MSERMQFKTSDRTSKRRVTRSSTDAIILSINPITYLNIISIFLFVNVYLRVHKVFKYALNPRQINICNRLQKLIIRELSLSNLLVSCQKHIKAHQSTSLYRMFFPTFTTVSGDIWSSSCFHNLAVYYIFQFVQHKFTFSLISQSFVHNIVIFTNYFVAFSYSAAVR